MPPKWEVKLFMSMWAFMNHWRVSNDKRLVTHVTNDSDVVVNKHPSVHQDMAHRNTYFAKTWEGENYKWELIFDNTRMYRHQ